jgi:hypothetical protein
MHLIVARQWAVSESMSPLFFVFFAVRVVPKFPKILVTLSFQLCLYFPFVSFLQVRGKYSARIFLDFTILLSPISAIEVG